MSLQPLIGIVGPTASGKTAVAAALAADLGGEVVCADSMQIYQGMSILTAKPTPEEMLGVPHHLVDFLPPEAPFSVADYVTRARAMIADIAARGKLPVLCGGTGLYVSSLIDNVRFDDTCADEALRAELTKFALDNGNEALWERLALIDPETAAQLHPNNLPRVVRALEVFTLTGEKPSVRKIASRAQPSAYAPMLFGLTTSTRDKLYARINERVDGMVAAGMVEEACAFYAQYRAKTASQAIGYKELIPYFEGTETRGACIEKIKRESRHYAKRQLTWFRRDSRIEWLETDTIESVKKIIEKIKKNIAKTEYL
ncbi:MAG: tRNA (adenosine(37)-N6)-dimethylallyltransferase MiaA [Oscillospiraceae bacterium]